MTPQAWYHLAMVLLFPVAAVWAASWSGRARLRRPLVLWLARVWSAARRRQAPGAVPASKAGANAPGWTVRSTLLLAAVAAGAWAASTDDVGKVLLETHLAARNGMWDRVLAKAREIPVDRYSPYVMNDVNDALFHKGRLAYEMFTYPQVAGWDSAFLAVSLPEDQPPTYQRLAEVFYGLGFVNDAEHLAHEALEQRGQQPATLRLLAKINILKGMPEAARTFIAALSKEFLHRRWARDYLRKLDADPLLANDEEMQRARAGMVRAEYTAGLAGDAQPMGATLVRALEQQLRINKHNKKAFEYLMAHYLLTRQLDKVVANLLRIDDFGYPDIPRHYEEAIFLYSALHGGAKVPLYGRQLSREVAESFRLWGQLLFDFKDDMPAAWKALMKSHDRTYLLYATLGFSDARMASLSAKPSAVTGATP